MGTWPYWVCFFAIGWLAFLVVRRLDDLERSSSAREGARTKPARDGKDGDEQT